jgi:hypothetical protein
MRIFVLLAVFALVPTVPHQNLPGAMCDYGTYLNDGRRRVELLTTLLAHESNMPVVVIKGGAVTPFMIAGAVLIARPAGCGTFGARVPLTSLAALRYPASRWLAAHALHACCSYPGLLEPSRACLS